MVLDIKNLVVRKCDTYKYDIYLISLSYHIIFNTECLGNLVYHI